MEARDETQRSVSDVLTFYALNLLRFCGLAGKLSFGSLHTGFFVGAYNVYILFAQCWSFVIRFAYVLNVCLVLLGILELIF